MAVDFDREVITSGYNLSKINTNFERIETALDDAVSRSGQTPNQMETDFDMNSNDILNVNRIDTELLYIDGVPVDAADLGINPDALIPEGGTDGQVLTKQSSTNYDVAWEDVPEGIPAGGTDGQVLTKQSGTDYDADWETPLPGYTDEEAQDAVGNILTDSASIDFTYSDVTPSITAVVKDDGITSTKISAVVENRTALKALDTTVDTVAWLKESGREGMFIWRSGDYSTYITADTQEGIYIKADAIASTSGSWVREYVNEIDVRWFGADSTGVSNSVSAFDGWWSMVVFLGTCGYISPGTFKLSSQLNWDCANRANGVYVRGAGATQSRLSFDTGVTSPNLIIQKSNDGGIFYARFIDFFVSGSVDGKLVQLGQTDFGDAFNHTKFDFVAQNSSAGTNNVAVEVNYSVFGEHKIVANCNANGNGIALDIRQSVSGLWWGGGGNADIAVRLFGNTYSNTFLNFDHEEVDIGLQSLTSTVANNTWMGCVWSINDVAAFDMQAGKNNVVIGETLSAVGATALTSVGLVMENWQERVIASWAGTTSHTGNTTETTLATIDIPAGAMGPNGYIEVLVTWQMTNNANTKTMFGRLGGTGGTAFLQYALASSATAQTITVINNVNAQNSQIGSHSNYQGLGNTTGALITSAVDTSAATTFVLRGQLGNAADTITLKRYIVKVCYRP